MPYIEQSRRRAIFPQDATADGIKTPGELNYVLTMLVRQYWLDKQCYQSIADITGVLANVSEEFYRRIAAPYEDEKRAQNGDVY